MNLRDEWKAKRSVTILQEYWTYENRNAPDEIIDIGWKDIIYNIFEKHPHCLMKGFLKADADDTEHGTFMFGTFVLDRYCMNENLADFYKNTGDGEWLRSIYLLDDGSIEIALDRYDNDINKPAVILMKAVTSEALKQNGNALINDNFWECKSHFEPITIS